MGINFFLLNLAPVFCFLISNLSLMGKCFKRLTILKKNLTISRKSRTYKYVCRLTKYPSVIEFFETFNRVTKMGATKEQAERTKENILRGALRTFSEKGLAKARLEDIAKEVGVTRGAIYWHFENKLQLFSELFKKTIKIVLKDARKILESELSPLEKIRTLLIHLGTKSIEDEDYRAIGNIFNYQYEWTRDVTEVVNELAGRAAEVGETLMLKTIEEGIALGEIQDSGDAKTIAKAITIFIHGYSNATSGQVMLIKKEEITPVVDIFLNGIKKR